MFDSFSKNDNTLEENDTLDYSQWSKMACKLKSTIKPRMNTYICGESAATNEEFGQNVEKCIGNAISLYGSITGLIDQLVTFRNIIVEKQISHTLAVSETRKKLSTSMIFQENNDDKNQKRELALNDCHLPSDILYRILIVGSSTLTNHYGHLSFCDILNVKMTCTYFEKNVMDVCFWDDIKTNMLLSCFNTQGKKIIAVKRTSNECGESIVLPYVHAYNNVMFELFLNSAHWLKYNLCQNYRSPLNRKETQECYLNQELLLDSEKSVEKSNLKSFFEGDSKKIGRAYLDDICKHLGFGVDMSQIKLLDIFEEKYKKNTKELEIFHLDDILATIDPKNA
jgi:hypothetical protein